METDRALDDITFIKRVIADSQRLLVDNGKIYILWSALAISCIVLKYAKDAAGFGFGNLWIYIPAILAGMMATHVLKKRSIGEGHARTYSQKILAAIWTSWAASIVILAVIGYVSGGIGGAAIPAVIAAVMGGGQFASGVASNSIEIRNAAAGWWIGAIAMFFAPGEHNVAVLGVLLIVFQLVPGVRALRRWKRGLLAERT